MSIYFDNASTTPLHPQVKQYITELLDQYYNPSSIYQAGRNNREIIESTRDTVRRFINAPDESQISLNNKPQYIENNQNKNQYIVSKNIIFTPSGSAANTLMISGYYKIRSCIILYCPTMHKSVLRCVAAHNRSYPLKVDNNGVIDIKDLRDWLDTHRDEDILVVAEYGNSEIGTIQPIKEIIDLVHFYNKKIVVDCTATIPTTPLDVTYLDMDGASFAGHKLGSLKGVGILYRKSDFELSPLIYGVQEDGLVGGTENLLGIASLGRALELYDYSIINSYNIRYLWDKLRKIPDCYLVGQPIGYNKRLEHNLFICFKGVMADQLVALCDLEGLMISAGSACNNYSPELSPTLVAIGIDPEDMNSCIRLSLNGCESQKTLDSVALILKNCVEKLRQ